jgi:renalase
VRDLASRHVVHWGARVVAVERRDDGWRLHVDGGIHDVEMLVIAIPAEQAAALLAGVAADAASRAAAAVSEPCWTVMMAFSEAVAAEGDCWTKRAGGAIGWAARNSAKPGRAGPESWVVQATPTWSRDHIDADPDAVAADLGAALAGDLGVELPRRIGTAAHLWRFARCAEGGGGVVYDRDRRLGLCGDWLIGPRVESAWLSGVQLAERIGADV